MGGVRVVLVAGLGDAADDEFAAYRVHGIFDAEADRRLAQVRGLLFRRGGKEVGRLVDIGLAVGCRGRCR